VIAVADYMKFSLRLDYDNPDHDKIITALENLDKKRHKTKTQFVVTALKYYIDYLNISGAEELLKERIHNLEQFVVTRREFEDQISIIRAELKAELYEDIVSMVEKTGSLSTKSSSDSNAENDLSKYAGIMDSVMSWSED
jgi:hypothetical protein